MITPEELKALPDDLVDLYEKLEDDLLYDISSSIAKNGAITETTRDRIESAFELGIDIKERVKELNDISDKEIERLFEDLAIKNMETDYEIYELAGLNPKSFKESPNVMQYVAAVINKTKGDLHNITGTLGFTRYKNGASFVGLKDAYREAANFANIKLSSGAYNYNQIIRQAVIELADSGIRFVDYDSGVTRHIDVAVRTSLMTSSAQMSGEISLMNAYDVGCDLMEITAHAGARPTHHIWQGKIVSLSGRRGYLSLDDIGYGDVTGFQGANCRHSWFPYFEGISKPAYTRDRLRNIDPPPFYYEGKKYTAYEGSQKLRQIERSIRKSKRRLVSLEGAGLKDDFTAESIRLRRKRDLYKDFARTGNLPMQNARNQVYKYDRSVSMKAVWAERKSK